MTRKHSEKYTKECDDKIERIPAGPGNPAEKLSKFRHNAIEGGPRVPVLLKAL